MLKRPLLVLALMSCSLSTIADVSYNKETERKVISRAENPDMIQYTLSKFRVYMDHKDQEWVPDGSNWTEIVCWKDKKTGKFFGYKQTNTPTKTKTMELECAVARYLKLEAAYKKQEEAKE